MNVEFFSTMQLASDAMSGSVDPNEVLQYFSWWAYAAIAIGYTVFVFLSGIIDKFVGLGRRNQSGQGYIPDDSAEYSGKIVGPISRVLRIHGLFLLILFCALRMVAFALPYLPHWMTEGLADAKNVHASVVDYIGLFFVATLAFIERRRLCSKPKTP